MKLIYFMTKIGVVGIGICFTTLLNAQIWDSLGTVVPGDVKYIGEHNGKLYISKVLGTANGVNLYGIGTWDGNVWDSVGGGIDGEVLGSAIYNGKLFFGGLFQYAGGPYPYGTTPRIRNLTSWDGTQYSNPGFPSAWVNTIHTYKNYLYIGLGNSLPTINGQTYSGILRYNDTVFSSVGGGVFTNFRQVIAMTEYNGDLIVAGRFDLAGTLPVNNIARWDGNQWHTMGDGLNYFVRALCVDTVNNILYAGGSFNASGNIYTGNTAKWDGTTWLPIDTTFIHPVEALAIYKGFLYAGTNTNGAPSSLHKFNGSNWIPIHPHPTGGSGRSLKVYQDWLYFAGAYMINGVPYYACRYKDTTTVGLPSAPIQNENSITIHPNPAKNKISLTFGQPVNGRVDVAIYNAKGDMILRKQFAIVQEQITIDLPVGSKSGMYLCKITGKGIEMSGKFVIE